MNKETFGKVGELPELQIVTPTPEKQKKENPMPPELLNVDPDDFLDEQEEIDREDGIQKPTLQ